MAAPETLIALVRHTGKATPNGVRRETFTRIQWNEIDKDGSARELVWTDASDHNYALRVGLYRPRITPQNPWRRSATRHADGGPATQYAAINLL